MKTLCAVKDMVRAIVFENMINFDHLKQGVALHICIAYLQCIYALHKCIVYMQCVYALHICNAYPHCIHAMHICIAYMQCIYAKPSRNHQKYDEPLLELSKSNGSYPTSCGTIYFFEHTNFRHILLLETTFRDHLKLFHDAS